MLSIIANLLFELIFCFRIGCAAGPQPAANRLVINSGHLVLELCPLLDHSGLEIRSFGFSSDY